MGLKDQLLERDRRKALNAKADEVGLAALLGESDAQNAQYHQNKDLRTAFPVLSSEYGDSLAEQQRMQAELGSLQKAQQFYPDFKQRQQQAAIDQMEGSALKNATVAALNVVPEAMRIIGQGGQLLTGGLLGQDLENLGTGVSQDIYRDYATPKLMAQSKLLAEGPNKLDAITANPGAAATIAAPSLIASATPSTLLGSAAGKTALRMGLNAQRAGDVAGDVANLSNVFMNASQGFAEKNAEGMNPLQNLGGALVGAAINRALGSKLGGGAEGSLARAMSGTGAGTVGKALLTAPVKGALDELADNLSIETSKAVSENRTPEVAKTVEDSLIDMMAGGLLGGLGDVSSAARTAKQANDIKADPVAKAIWDLEQEEKAKQQQATPTVSAKPETAPQQPEQENKANPVLNALNNLQQSYEESKPQEEVKPELVAEQAEQTPVAEEPQAQTEVRRIDRKILQNRKRDDKDSVNQMRKIANAPDYGRVGYSRDFANGAPVVAFGSIPEEQKGRTDYAVSVTGERIPVQYAVVDADTVSTSNDINGAENPDYGLTDRVTAIAGNGRMTALGQAYRQGSAQAYRQEMTEDTMHGVNPQVIAKMKNPVLVRIMPNERVRDDIGDMSNISSNKSLSAIETARNDANRVDLDSLEFNEDGTPTRDSLSRFVSGMPDTERGSMMDKEGRATVQAVDRLNNAIFAKAYNNDDITAMYAEATDPEAKLVVNALARLAPKMAKLEGCGELDFRNALVDAVNAIVQGKRKGLKMQDILAQQDFLADPDVALFIELFARNPRSNKDVVAILSEAADFAYNEATKSDEDMFGEVQKASRGDVMNYVRDEFNKVKEAKNGKQAKQQANVQDASGSIGASQNVDGRDAGANPQSNERAGSANAQADESFSLSGQTEQEIIADEKAEEERQAQAEREEAEAEKQEEAKNLRKEIDQRNEDYANDFTLEDDTVTGEDALRDQKPLFSRKGEIKDPLVTLHNITENGLMKAARLGGLPAPSLAVSKVESPLQQFGEITLVGTKDLADPTKNPVFSVDAYTARFPKLDWSKSYKKAEGAALAREIEKAQGQVSESTNAHGITYYLRNRPNRDEVVDKLTSSAAGMAMFLNHKGIKFKPVRDAIGFPNEWETKKSLQGKIKRYQAEYEAYIASRVEEAFDTPNIMDGNRSVPMTIENVVRAMTRHKDVRGAEGGFLSNTPGSIRARASKQYASMEDLKADRDRVVDRDASWESEKQVDAKFDAFIGDVVKFWKYPESSYSYSFAKFDAAADVLASCAANPTKANIKRVLKREGFENVDDETIEVGIDALKSAAKVLTDYLEVKPQRAVAFKEFAGAVVPNTISDEARSFLEGEGLEIQTYNPKLEGGRVRATQRLINRLNRERGDIKFSRNPRTGKMDIKLSIAWHGSPHIFEVFLTDHIGTGEGAQAHGWGLYFALNRSVAEHYREALAEGVTDKVFLNGREMDEYSKFRNTAKEDAEYHVAYYLDYPDHSVSRYDDDAVLKAIATTRRLYEQGLARASQNNPNGPAAEKWREKLRELDKIQNNLDQYHFSSEHIENHGRLFKVEIPDADVMLDEQKSLNEQSKFVQDAIDQVIEDLKANDLLSESEYKWFKRNALELNGFDIYWTIGAKYDKKFGDDFDSVKATSLLLNKHGIKGIRYDGHQDGPCAVVFDDQAVKVLEYYSKNKPEESTSGSTVEDVTASLESDKDIGEAFAMLRDSGEVNVVQSIEDLPEEIRSQIDGSKQSVKLVIKRSDNGDIQGLYDPRSRKAYLIADALTDETAKPVFLHELGVHSAYSKNPLKLERQMKLARNMVNNGYAQGNEIAVRVKQRLFDANEIDSMDDPIPMEAAEECLSYLVEETVSTDDRGPFRKWFDSLMSAIKQWLRNHGVNVNLNEWDFVEMAKGNVVAMARQSGKDMSISYSKKGNGGSKPTPPTGPSSKSGRFLERDEMGRFRLKAGRKLIEGLGYTVAAVDGLLANGYKFQSAPQALRMQIREMKAKIEKAGMDATEMAKLMKEMPADERKLISDVIEQELATGVNPPAHVLQIATKITQIMDDQAQELVSLGMLSKDSYERYRGKYLPRFYLRADDKEAIGFFGKIFGGRARMRGVAGTHLKGRGIFKEVPAKAAHNFIKLGWEVRDPNYEYVNGKVQPKQGKIDGVDETGMVVIWRDYTPLERAEMGEIRDASYRFAVGYMQTQRDLAIGRLFKAIASNPEWTSSTAREGFVYLPKNEVPDAGGVLKYGALAGKYVDEVVLSHISHIEDVPDGVVRAFRQGMAFWKEGKTAMNPVSHLNNTVGNFVAAHLAGVNMWDAKAYSKALHSLRTADASFKEAQDAGLFTGSFSQEEFVKSLPEELKHLAAQEETGFKKFGDTLMRVFTWGLRDKLRKAYEFEDAFFKMAIYQKARESGMDPQHAVDYAHKFVFVYDTLPEGARKLRNSLFPFFAWTYQAVPMLATAAVCYPWRFFAPAAILFALNKAFFLAAAGDDDDTWAERWKKASQLEDAERTLLPKYMQGSTLFMTPKFLRLGIDEATGLPQYINLSHMVPGGNFLDFENQNGGVPLPEILTPNHPLLNAFMAYIGNQDMFSGFDMTKETDSTGEKVQKYAEYTWKQLTPAIAIGNYHWGRLMDGVAGATGVTMPIDRTGVNRHGEVMPLDVAIKNMVGLKVRTFDPDNEMNRQMRGHAYNQRMIQSEKRSAYRRARAGALPIDSYQEFAKKSDEKVRKVREEMGEVRKARATIKDLSGK